MRLSLLNEANILTEAFTFFRVLIDEDLGIDEVAEGGKGGHQIVVPELGRQVVDKEARTRGACNIKMPQLGTQCGQPNQDLQVRSALRSLSVLQLSRKVSRPKLSQQS